MVESKHSKLADDVFNQIKTGKVTIRCNHPLPKLKEVKLPLLPTVASPRLWDFPIIKKPFYNSII